MLCLNCQTIFADGLKDCPKCGLEAPTSWELLTTVYPPEDNIIKGLLEVCGIPVLLRGEAIAAIEGITFGPLAEVRIFIPTEKMVEAKEILASEYEQIEPLTDDEDE